MSMFISRQILHYHNLQHLLRHFSNLRSKYAFTPPLSLRPQDPNVKCPPITPKKPPYRPPSSLRIGQKPFDSNLPFDFRYSYTESNPSVKPIGLRGPKYSPFGPGRLSREWTGVCAPVERQKVMSVDDDVEDVDWKLQERRKVIREDILGDPLTDAERKILVDKCQRKKTKRQINLGRDGLTHNMLNVIHNHWKDDEAIRIKCMGVPTIDMENVCTQLEDKTYGKIIHRHGSLLVLYRGRNYKPKKRPVIPLMLWKPQEPVYPKLVKTTIEGLSIEETKEMRKRGLAVPALTKLSRNGFYQNLVPMVRDAFLVEELVRIDCTGLDKSDRKKVGVKLRDLVPCIPVTFAKEQIVVWRGPNYEPLGPNYEPRGPNYEPPKDRFFLREQEPSEMSIDNMVWDS